MDLTDFNALKNDVTTAPPPIPSRNGQTQLGVTSAAAGFNNFGGGNYSSYPNYSNMSSYGYNGYSNYSPFGMSSGMGMGGYGAGLGATNNSSNFFVRAAEESSRNAFQSIESVVHAFSAVSAMFESTYYAVFNSFRAVVGVADQFYRLKTHLSGIISALAIIRVLKYFMRRCLRFLKIAAALARGESIDTNINDAWSISKDINDSEKFVKENLKRQTNWPLILFLGVVLGGPYLIWKILTSIESLNKDDTLWMTGKIDHFIAVSEHDFDAVNVDELSFKRGQRIIIAPKEYQPKLRGWLLGSIDGKTQGIMPANYLKILGKKIGENSAGKNNQQPDNSRSNEENISLN